MASEQPISHEGLEYSLQLLNKKWVPYICYYLASSKQASMRYAELKRVLPFDISDKVFSSQLRDLLEAGLLTKRIETDSNGSVIQYYLLTRKGHSFANILFLLKDWGSVNRILDADQKRAEEAGVNLRRVYQSPTNNEQGSSDAIVWSWICYNTLDIEYRDLKIRRKEVPKWQIQGIQESFQRSSSIKLLPCMTQANQ